MSSTQRSYASDLTEAHLSNLIETPQAYEFLQAVRLLHRRVVGSGKYAKLEIKYRSSLSLASPMAEIESLTVEAEQEHLTQVIICPAIIGLTGSISALPAIYTDYLSSRVIHVKDKAAPEFLDLFNHRLTELYVEASWFYHLPLQYELNRQRDKYLLSLRALARQPKKLTSIDSLIAYAGMIAPNRLTALQLSHVLSQFLAIRVSVEQFVPEWFELPPEEQTALGGKHASLGVSTFCGAKTLQFDSKIKVVCHQLTHEQYLRLLPMGDMSQVIATFVRQWCGVMLTVEVQLELHKHHIKPLSLAEGEFGALGQGGFLLTQPALNHHDGTRYLLSS